MNDAARVPRATGEFFLFFYWVQMVKFCYFFSFLRQLCFDFTEVVFLLNSLQRGSWILAVEFLNLFDPVAKAFGGFNF